MARCTVTGSTLLRACRRSRGAAARAGALATLEAEIDGATLEELIAEGSQMDEEGVCALALDASKD